MRKILLTAAGAALVIAAAYGLRDRGDAAIHPALASGDRWALSDEPVLAIGREDDPAYALFRVGQAGTLPSGAIAVSNGQQEVRIFDSAGRYLRTLGRKGKGPGEFTQLWTIHPLPADSLIAHDTYPPRLTLFDPEGRHVRSFELEAQPFYLGRLEDGSWIGTRWTDLEPPSVPGIFQRHVDVLSFSATGEIRDTLARLAEARFFGTGAGYWGAPFSPTAWIAVAGGRIYTAEGDRYRVEARSPVDEAVLGVVEPGMDNRAVDEAMRTRYLEDLTAARRGGRRESAPGGSGGRARQEDAPFPEHLPALGGLLAGADGSLWVRRYTLPYESQEWHVYSGERLVAWLAVPRELRITEVGADYVLGVWTDALDVQTVRKYGIVRGDAGPPRRRATRPAGTASRRR